MSTEIELLDALKEVIDPELMVNIVDLGLIYDVAQDGETVNPAAIRFVNRLSDFLFVAAFLFFTLIFRWCCHQGTGCNDC